MIELVLAAVLIEGGDHTVHPVQLDLFAPERRKGTIPPPRSAASPLTAQECTNPAQFLPGAR